MICRHTFATMALSSGVDVKTLSSMLGHYSAGFTLDTYTHITNDMQRGAAEKIGGFMESATANRPPGTSRPAGGKPVQGDTVRESGIKENGLARNGEPIKVANSLSPRTSEQLLTVTA